MVVQPVLKKILTLLTSKTLRILMGRQEVRAARWREQMKSVLSRRGIYITTIMSQQPNLPVPFPHKTGPVYRQS